MSQELRTEIKQIKKYRLPQGKYDNSYYHAPRLLVPEIGADYATFWDLCGY